MIYSLAISPEGFRIVFTTYITQIVQDKVLEGMKNKSFSNKIARFFRHQTGGDW